MKRNDYADLILARLDSEKDNLTEQFRVSGRVQSCFIDNVLPEGLAREIYSSFPDPSRMMLKKSLREFKYVAAQMNRYDSILEEIVYAFQDPRIVVATQKITGIRDLIPDEDLYAGGISLMGKGHFLNPHLDNSHDKDRKNYRVLNLLYYVSPEWRGEFGGNLELWDDGPKGKPRQIVSAFNRLVFMATHEKSWHSVNQVKHDQPRCCVSNYYFSAKPLEEHEYFHITSFRGRPEQPVRDLVLQADIAARSAIRKVAKKGLVEPKHVYHR